MLMKYKDLGRLLGKEEQKKIVGGVADPGGGYGCICESHCTVSHVTTNVGGSNPVAAVGDCPATPEPGKVCKAYCDCTALAVGCGY